MSGSDAAAGAPALGREALRFAVAAYAIAVALLGLSAIVPGPALPGWAWWGLFVTSGQLCLACNVAALSYGIEAGRGVPPATSLRPNRLAIILGLFGVVVFPVLFLLSGAME